MNAANDMGVLVDTALDDDAGFECRAGGAFSAEFTVAIFPAGLCGGGMGVDDDSCNLPIKS
jgi:hypothetical protein